MATTEGKGMMKQPRAEFLDAMNLLVRGLNDVLTNDEIRSKEAYEWVKAFPQYVKALENYFDPESDPLLEKGL